MQNLWYKSLNKSVLTPPAKVFTICWAILYFLITVSFILYLKSGISKKDIIPIALFILGIILNFSWSYVFFVRHEILLSVFVIIGIILLLVPTIILFYKKRKVSGLLLLPYLMWLLFALYLNFDIYIKNQ